MRPLCLRSNSEAARPRHTTATAAEVIGSVADMDETDPGLPPELTSPPIHMTPDELREQRRAVIDWVAVGQSRTDRSDMDLLRKAISEAAV